MHCDEKLLAAIGAIAVESTYLERFVDTAIRKLSGLSDTISHAVLAKHNTMEARFDLLLELGSTKLKHAPKRCAEFEQIIKALKDANSNRNTAIHGVWYREMVFDGKGLLGYTLAEPKASRKPPKPGEQGSTMRAETAHKVAKQISEAHYALHEFAYRTWRRYFPHSTLRELSQPQSRKRRGSQMVATKRGTSQ